MYKEIHKKSLQLTLKENLSKIDLQTKKITILLVITSIIILILCVIIIPNYYQILLIPFSIYCLFCCVQIYNLLKNKNRILQKINEK